MRLNRRGRFRRGAVVLAVSLAASAFTAAQASAATGDVLRTITADNPQGCGINVGVAFDGTDLYMSCFNTNTIDKISPATGALTGQVNVSGLSGTGIGAMAYDAGRARLWVCSVPFSTEQVWLVNPADGTSQFQFQSNGCADGLAYDGSDDTLWASPDADCTVTHYQTNGTVIAPFNACAAPGWQGPGNSGIAVGGEKLYLANNGGSQVFEVPKDFSSATLFFTSDRRLEDLECDDVTFAPKAAMWIQDAFDRILTAVEIPVGSCRLGGQPGDGECSDGIDNDHDGKIDFGTNPHHNDPDCDSPTDNERPECSDHVDNDGDGKTDWSRNRFHRDPQCSSPRDDDESNGH